MALTLRALAFMGEEINVQVAQVVANAVANAITPCLDVVADQQEGITQALQEVTGASSAVSKLVEETRGELGALAAQVKEMKSAVEVANARPADAVPQGPHSYAAAAVPAMTAEQADILARGARMRRQILVDKVSDSAIDSLAGLDEMLLKAKANLAPEHMEAKMEGTVFVGTRRLPNGGVVFDCKDESTACWLKSVPIMAQFIAALGSSCVYRPRRIEMVAEMVSVDTSISDAGTWRAVEKDSGLSDGDIIGARWIKAPDHRTPVNSTPADTPPSTPSSLTPSPPSSDDQLPTFEQPQAISILHTPSITTTTFHTTTPDYDSDEMPMEAWDGDTDKLSAQDFLRGFHRDVKVSTSSADKAKAFKNYLVANSDTDDWYKTLPAATKVNMDLIDIAIEAQYPAEAMVQQSPAEYTTDLLRLKLTMEELGTKVTIADRQVWAHHAWCAKMMCLALKANVSTTTTYIEQVHVELLGPLRKNIGKMFANWAAFIKAIHNVNTAKLVLDMKEWHEEKAQRDTVTKMLMRVPPVQASPTAGIRAQPPTRDSDRRCSSPRNLFTAPRAQQQPQAPHAPYQAQARAPPAIQPPLEGDQHRILVEAMARIIHHPDTDAGRLAHGANYMRGCDALQDQCVSAREQRWRRIAAQALKEAPVGVRAVGFGSWDVDDFGRPFGGDEDRF
ncbi:hypothetical protein B0H10DRAFT_2218764 [Mycena sp. CBHHK59/15]|nr:hypothetical protein B0H10DRAFT_2218764 [Mycena sp. CBHHK59/15]